MKEVSPSVSDDDSDEHEDSINEINEESDHSDSDSGDSDPGDSDSDDIDPDDSGWLLVEESLQKMLEQWV